ncbi:MAG: ABC transporter ATP-binding protein/permease [Castellaniella sp.]|nr:ABC transporter ATP-binding protein/permease [Castellaniella sp.]
MTIFQLARGFWAHLKTRRKQQLAVLLVLMILASFAEVLSLGAVLPFLGVLTQPERVFTYPPIQGWLAWMRLNEPRDLLMPITLVFISAVLLAGMVRLLLLYFSTKLSYAIGADFSYEIYRRTLYQPYTVHISRNSSEVISGVTDKVSAVINYFLTPILSLFGNCVILISILSALLVVNPWVSLITFIGFGLIYGGVIIVTRKRLAAYSAQIADKSTQVVKILQEGLGGIRDVLIDGSQEAYSRLYQRADVPLRNAYAGSVIIGGAPRFAAEALGMAFIAILAYLMASKEGEIGNAIALLGVLALGAQRLLPVLQQGYMSIILLRSGRYSLRDALSLLNQPMNEALCGAGVAGLPFLQGISMRHMSFRYSDNTPLVLRNLNLWIPKGGRTGFIGATGSGKSTLLDIVMGLLLPTEGGVWIDGIKLDSSTQRAWHCYIAHVPQNIYLSDASISENIAFGVPPDQIDLDRVYCAAQQAQIAGDIDTFPDRYDTNVGERGVRLSGGQRQRIGIARALYKQAAVIIFDEATSALDNETERAVMDAIDGLDRNLTILMVAHRLSTLERCDQVVELWQGGVRRVGSYAEIVRSV